MKLFRSWLAKLLLSLVIFFCVERFCTYATRGFRVNKILWHPVAYESSKRTKPKKVHTPSTETVELLDQPFYFFDKGVQFYAFIGQDKKTILKFFKHNPTRPQRTLLHVPGPWKRKAEKKEEKRKKHILSSCRIALEELKEETGLIYAHVNPEVGSNVPRFITIVDNLGISHSIDINRTIFVLQHKAEPFFKTLQALIEKDDMPAAKKTIDSLLSVIKNRFQKGISNGDSVPRNYGIWRGQVIEIDVGAYEIKKGFEESQAYKSQIVHQTKRVKTWLKQHSPELAEYLVQQLEAIP